MWLVKYLVGDRPSWHKEPINFLNIMLSIRKVRLLITSRYMSMQSYECVIVSKMFLIDFISYGCNGGALVFLGGAEASASPSFALPMFITIKKIIILHLFLGVPAATVGGTGTPWHTRGYAPAIGIPHMKTFYCSVFKIWDIDTFWRVIKTPFVISTRNEWSVLLRKVSYNRCISRNLNVSFLKCMLLFQL